MKPTTATPKLLAPVHEIFTSINGEVNMNGQGSICQFVRLAGCNLQCRWCDTPQAQDITNGRMMSVDGVVDELMIAKKPPFLRSNIVNVTITGGEPLLHEHYLVVLITELVNNNFRVSVETNGSLLIPNLTPLLKPLIYRGIPLFSPSSYRRWAGWVVDVKLPSSGEYKDTWYQNLPNDFGAFGNDWLKFPIGSDRDFFIARDLLTQSTQFHKYNIAFSPIEDYITADMLLNKLIQARLTEAILNIQIHKMICVK